MQFLKIFDFFENFRRLDPPWRTGQKKAFDKLNPKHVQITFGHFWERFWAFLQFWKVFDFFENFRRLDPPWKTGQKKFFEKIAQNIFKTRLDSFGNDCGQFWNFESFLICLKIFEDSTLHRTLGKKIFEKITPKYVQNTFGQLWETFWVCLEFWKIFDFFENFRRLDPPWNTGQKFFRKKYPKTCSKHVWTFLGTILAFSAILKSFWFFWKFSTTRPSEEHWAKTLFRKKRLKTCSTHVWTLLGTISGIFAIFKNFRFFWNFSTTQPCMEHWAKKIFEKIHPKYVQSTFGHFWERFRAFLQFLKSFESFENFRRLDPPWHTGQKKFFEKLNPKHVQITFGHFWERFRAFLQFLKIFDFFENFRRLDPPRNTGQKNFSK